MAVPRIQDYAIIGNCRSAALISSAGSIDWLCWPRFDSPSVFAAILDPAIGGTFQVAAVDTVGTQRRYAGDSNVLITEQQTADGVLRLTDLMTVHSEQAKWRLLVPEHELIRVVECVRGTVAVEACFQPRPDYARRRPELRAAGSLGLRFEDGPRLYTLRSDVAMQVGADDTARAWVQLSAGQRCHFSLTYDEGSPGVLPPFDDAYCRAAIGRTVRWWTDWAGRCRYEGPYQSDVVRSMLILKLLAYAPSGAVVAAPTTSLPERVGGDLNWDYRFCWVRDASLTVKEFLDLGYPDEAAAFVGWLLHTTRLTRPRLSVLYDVFGELPRKEELLPHLEGHRQARPVRIRNAAVDQLQLDSYGEVIDAVAQMCRRGATLDRETRRMLRQFGDYVCDNWDLPDHGIWEPRTWPQHHTHSRALCWTALDRLLELHRAGVLPEIRAERLAQTRQLIRENVEAHSWNPEIHAYTQVQGDALVDASTLLLAWYGFADPRGPRMSSTFRRICERLQPAPRLLYRYEQSRAAGEGTFGICSFWAAEYLARGGGSLREAQDWFEALLPYANDVGIMAEQFEPSTGEALGNSPQAYTHVGLISAALAIEERRAGDEQAQLGAVPPHLESLEAGGATL